MSLIGQIILQSLKAVGSVSNLFTVKEITAALEGSGFLGASRRILMPDGTPVPDETLVSYNPDGSMVLHSKDPRYDGKTLQTVTPSEASQDPYDMSFKGAQDAASWRGPVTSADYELYGAEAQRMAGPSTRDILRDPRLLAGLGIAGIAGTVIGAQVLKSRKKTKKAPKKKAPTKKTRKARKRKAPTKKTKSKRSPGGSHFALAGGARGSHRIKYTKTGQPYILEHSGKARFIKRSSARQARARTGGYG